MRAVLVLPLVPVRCTDGAASCGRAEQVEQRSDALDVGDHAVLDG
jgi:hypothetical protein